MQVLRVEEALLLVMAEELVCGLQPDVPFLRLDDGVPIPLQLWMEPR